MAKVIAYWTGPAWKLQNLLLDYPDFCADIATKGKRLKVKHL